MTEEQRRSRGCQALYDANKVADAVHEDVSIDIDELGQRGIINCRVNGGHVQVRF